MLHAPSKFLSLLSHSSVLNLEHSSPLQLVGEQGSPGEMGRRESSRVAREVEEVLACKRVTFDLSSVWPEKIRLGAEGYIF